MTTELTLAFPSKGRIKEMTEDFVRSCDLTVKASGRNYSGTVVQIPGIRVMYCRPTEIPELLFEGKIDGGITGEDLLREFLNERPFTYISLGLGFGKASLVTAVPKSWTDVEEMSDLADVCSEIRHGHSRGMRVATGFPNMTRWFFHEKGINDFRIIESSGATEGTPMAGISDVIVDITSTGSTLANNDLKTLRDGTLLESQICFFLSTKSSWNNQKCALIREFLTRIETRQQSSDLFSVRFTFPEESAQTVAREFQRPQDRFVIVGKTRDGSQVGEVLTAKNKLFDLSAKLSEKGASNITASKVDYLLGEKSKTYLKFMELLGRTA